MPLGLSLKVVQAQIQLGRRLVRQNGPRIRRADRIVRQLEEVNTRLGDQDIHPYTGIRVEVLRG